MINGEDISWTQADQYFDTLSLAGFSDWRRPNIEKLEGLCDPNRVGNFKQGNTGVGPRSDHDKCCHQ